MESAALCWRREASGKKAKLEQRRLRSYHISMLIKIPKKDRFPKPHGIRRLTPSFCYAFPF